MKVSFFAFDEASKQGRIVLQTYHSEAAKDDGKPAIPGEEVEVNIRAESAEQIAGFNAVIAAMESHGPKKVAYVLAKKLPKLADATDVLEQGQTALTDADVGLA
jgi:hypothetical protein